MKLDEQFLIDGLREKNKVVFDLIFTFYYSGLCAFANRYVNDSGAAEDIVQDFFVKLWFTDRSLQINTPLKSYLFAGVRNRSIDFLKHMKVRDKHSRNIPMDAGLVKPDELWEFSEAELWDILGQALDKLPPRTREIFELSRLKGFSNENIASKLQITRRTVEIQVSNALKILRRELKDFLPLLMLLQSIN